MNKCIIKVFLAVCVLALLPVVGHCNEDEQATLPKSLKGAGDTGVSRVQSQAPVPVKPKKNTSQSEKDKEDLLSVPSPLPVTAVTQKSPVPPAGYSVVFFDEFMDNRSGWYTCDDPTKTLQVQNGAYYFAHKRGEQGWNTYKPVGFRPDSDFVIEAVIRKVDGVQNYGFGLLFGVADGSKEYNNFIVSGNGKYSISRKLNDKFSTTVDWTKCEEIVPGDGATNKLTVQRVGDVVKYYVNGKYLTSTSYYKTEGSRCGFVVYNKQSIEVKSFVYMAKMP